MRMSCACAPGVSWCRDSLGLCWVGAILRRVERPMARGIRKGATKDRTIGFVNTVPLTANHRNCGCEPELYD
jgi:hypothetical protein